jgi:TatD DNase family protein
VIDSHCHLAGEEFESDLPDVIARAIAAGVTGALVVVAADDDKEYARAGEVAAAWSGIRLSVGIHPHTAGAAVRQPGDVARLVQERLDGSDRTRAIGEIGLDYHYDFSPRDIQQAVFREQIGLARQRRLPIVIHTREAEDDTFRILDEESARDVGGVFHCFSGDRAMARRALAAEFYVSLAGIVTFPRATELQEVARMLPLDRLLIETDSPYLAPVPHRGRRNEPARVVHIAETVARLRNTTIDAIGEAVRHNFESLFAP